MGDLNIVYYLPRQAIPIHVRRIRKCWKSKPKRKKEMKIESLRGIIVGGGGGGRDEDEDGDGDICS